VNKSSSRDRVCAAGLAAIAWTGVLLQCYLSLRLAAQGGRTIVSGMIVFLGYFTVLTNILVCVSLTATSLAPSSAPARFFTRAEVLGGIAANIAFVGLAYHFLLRNIWNPEGLQRVADVLLHYAVPVLYVLYWGMVLPKGSLRWTHPLWWSAYPAAYLAYAVVRGEMIGSYPYPFIDVAAIGYGHSMVNAFGLLLIFIVLGSAFVLFDRTIGRVSD